MKKLENIIDEITNDFLDSIKSVSTSFRLGLSILMLEERFYTYKELTEISKKKTGYLSSQLAKLMKGKIIKRIDDAKYQMTGFGRVFISSILSAHNRNSIESSRQPLAKISRIIEPCQFYVKNSNNKIIVDALVTSGKQISLIDEELSTFIGATIISNEGIKLRNVSGVEMDARLASVKFSYRNKDFELKVAIVPGLQENGYLMTIGFEIINFFIEEQGDFPLILRNDQLERQEELEKALTIAYKYILCYSGIREEVDPMVGQEYAQHIKEIELTKSLMKKNKVKFSYNEEFKENR